MSSSFTLDAWKHEYASNALTEVSIKWFWEHFDPENYSIWRADYLHNDELSSSFAASHILKGLHNRSESAALQVCFGSIAVRRKGYNFSITGYFIFPGQEIPAEIDSSVDFSFFKFQKIEPSQYGENRKEFDSYITSDSEDILDNRTFT